jgi:hypothetical protein
MAGSGHKLWAAGDVVGASGDTDINTALLQQVVGVYAASANRDAAFGGAGEPTLAEGMLCYLNDTNEFQVYTGSAWVTIGDPEVLIVDSANSRVGINTATPWESFDMAASNNLGVGLELTFGTHANSDNYVSYINFHGYQGGASQFRDVYWGNGKQGRLMYFDGSSGAVTVDGAFSKGSGTFDIAHPTKGGDWRLRHSFIEGPQADLIYRGTVTLTAGTATVDLDEASGMTAGTWEALCRDPWTMAASSGNAVEWVLDGSTLTITGPADAVCSWMVIAERQDDHIKADSPIADDDGHLIVEYERPEHVYGTPEPPA